MTQEYVEYVTGRLPELRRIALGLVGDPHRADDVVQETVTKLYVHWRRATRAQNLDAYVRTMLVRTFLDERRTRWAKVQLTGETTDPPPTDGSAATIDAITVRTALAQLPGKQRVVLVLRFLADLSVDQVAEILGCTAGTVKSQTFHGLSALRRQLGPAAEGWPGAGSAGTGSSSTGRLKS